jgi:ABC-type bacteriocin/lantibiotic exporter with double-glycine peptidase domain
MNQTNKISLLLLLFFVGTAISGFSQEVRHGCVTSTSPDGESIQDPDMKVAPSNLRCGVDSLFLALGYLDGELERKTYGEIAKFFPNIEREGTNIKAIETYLQNNGFYCRSALLDERTLTTMKTNSIAFLVRKSEPISHVVLLRRKEENLFQLIDTIKGIKMLSLFDAEKQSSSALFVAKNATDLPSEKTFMEKHGVTFVAFFCSAFLLVFLKRKRKTQIGDRRETRL